MSPDEKSQASSAGKAETSDVTVLVTVPMTRGQHRALKRAARDEGTAVSDNGGYDVPGGEYPNAI